MMPWPQKMRLLLTFGVILLACWSDCLPFHNQHAGRYVIANNNINGPVIINNRHSTDIRSHKENNIKVKRFGKTQKLHQKLKKKLRSHLKNVHKISGPVKEPPTFMKDGLDEKENAREIRRCHENLLIQSFQKSPLLIGLAD